MTSVSKTKTTMAATGTVDPCASPATAPDHRAASTAAAAAAANHDAGTGTVSKTSPASHPDGAHSAPNTANGP